MRTYRGFETWTDAKTFASFLKAEGYTDVSITTKENGYWKVYFTK